MDSAPEPPRDAWRRVRSLRANPGGFAATDPERRRVFAAALGQAEDLATAAQAVGPESKPLLLFYSLSQAGRAISANCFEGLKWTHKTHGLGVDDKFPSIVDFRIEPHAKGAFATVCEATGSPPLAGAATIGQIYASLPELRGRAAFDATAQGCLELRRQKLTPTGLALVERINRSRTLAELPVAEGQLADLLAGYPSAGGYAVRRERVNTWDADDTLSVEWPDASEVGGLRPLDDVGTPWQGSWYLRPELGGGRAPSVLMTWWALLQGLSVAARYAPAQWTAALDPDESPIATLLEEALEVADYRVPQLIAGGIQAEKQRCMKEISRDLGRSAGVTAAVPVAPATTRQVDVSDH